MNALQTLPLSLQARVLASATSETEQSANIVPEEHSEPNQSAFLSWADSYARSTQETKLLLTLHEAEKDRQELLIHMMHTADLSNKANGKNTGTVRPLWELCEEVIYAMVDQHNCLDILPYTQLHLKSTERAALEPPKPMLKPAPTQVQTPSPPQAPAVATPSLPTSAPLAPSEGFVVAGVGTPKSGAVSDLFAHLPPALIPGFSPAISQAPNPLSRGHTSLPSTACHAVASASLISFDTILSETWQGKCWEVLLNNFEELRTSYQIHQLDNSFVEQMYIKFVYYRLDPDRPRPVPSPTDPLKMAISMATFTEILEFALFARMETLWKVVANEIGLFSEKTICHILAVALEKDLMLLPERCLAFIDDHYFNIISSYPFLDLPSDLQAAIIGHKQNAIKSFYSEDERSHTACAAAPWRVQDYLDEEDFVPEWTPDADEDVADYPTNEDDQLDDDCDDEAQSDKE